MTERANQIIQQLYEKFPELIFKWENPDWPFLDDSACTLSVSSKTDKRSIEYEGGISSDTVKEFIDGFIDHAVSKLKK